MPGATAPRYQSCVATAPRTTPSRVRRRLLLALAVLVAGLLLLEAAVRVRLYLRTGSFVLVHSQEIDPATGLRIPERGRSTATLHIDSRGFRNPELDVPKPAGRVRIAFLGASTTFCGEASSDAATWPSLVCAALRAAHPRAEIDYVNAGVAGYVLDDILATLEQRVRPLEPDVIVLYEATNDLTKWTREMARAQGVYTEHADREDWLSGVSMAWYLVQKNLLVRQRQSAAEAGAGRAKWDSALAVPPFRERFARLVQRAGEIAPVVAVATFAQRSRPGQTPDEQRAAGITHFYYMPYMTHAAILQGFAAYNDVIRAIAREAGVILIEGEDTIPADAEHFTDSVHFTDAGCRWQAGRIVAGLEGAAAFRALVP